MGEIKVLHCLNAPSWGGLEIYSVELMIELQRNGLKQAALCIPGSRAADELKRASVEVFELPAGISKFAHARLIRRFIKEKGFTHLHSHTRLDMWACALAKWNKGGIKHIYNLYMNALPKQDFVHKWLFSKVDALCTSSQNILDDAKKNFPIAPKKLHLIRYGRKTDQYVHAPEKREHIRSKYNAEGKIVFGTLCRIDPGKGVRELVSALDHLTDEEIGKIQLWIVGDLTIVGKNPDGSIHYEGPSKELSDWIDRKIAEPRLKGHLVRIPFQKEYIPYIDALDVFALASYNETYSLSILDAMLMEKPVIGTNAGGTPEQIGHNERGTLVEAKNAKALAEGMRIYIQNPSLTETQGKIGRTWVLSQHNWPTTLQKTVEIYQKL
ncbi:glycosyltransferase family 4 protein [Bdellovibrio sp. HCB2-146]|uniref:glycosyltransferase family 4 protein n=1 Tax=Bdellovibrio sp. HCB2-146 TaxID=3394362 RepID=UPI0039BCF3F9